MPFIKISVGGHEQILNAASIQKILPMGTGTSIYIHDNGNSPPSYIQADQGLAHLELALLRAGLQVIDTTAA